MINFDYKNDTKIIFGKTTEGRVGEECIKYSDKVLLHYGGGSIKKSGLYNRIITSLKEQNITVIELSGVKPNPRLSLVQQGIKLCKEHGIGFILAVGGGSVIDSAKAIALGALYSGDVWDFYLNINSPIESLPVGVVLTIPAAGSETSGGSVITKEDEQLKKVVAVDFLRPKFAILNPELTLTLPDYQTSCGAADMLAHVFERYFTKVKNVDLTDRLCEATMKTIIYQAKKLVNNPKDYEARAELMWAGTVAHNDLFGTGRIADWASHGLEHELSAITDIAHGAGLAIIFPAWMKYVYKENLDRFVQFASRVFNIDINFENLEETALKGIEEVENFYKYLNLPVRLSEINLDESLIDVMAKKYITDSNKGNFKSLNREDCVNIYKLAF